MDSFKRILTFLMAVVIGCLICYTETESTTTPIATANNYFAMNLHKKLTESNKNLFFSPLSIGMALAMVHNGAKLTTRKEMRNVLGYNKAKLCKKQINAEYEKMLSSLHSESNCTLDIANALLVQQDFPILKYYRKILEKKYYALLQDVDFVNDPKGAAAACNDFVNQSTHGMIEKVVDEFDSSTIMALMNAVYFKGRWVKEFDKRQTEPDTFYNNGDKNNEAEVPMMHQTDKFRFKSFLTFDAVQLQYEGCDISMFLLLPHEMNGIEELEKKLTYDSISSINESLRLEMVDLYLPKLDLFYSVPLDNYLIALGMPSAFNRQANFQCISNVTGLAVSSVLHIAVCKVDEEGTEAAAVTVIGIGITSVMNGPIILKFDHPFYFFIVNLHGEIIFIGRVCNFQKTEEKAKFSNDFRNKDL